MAPASDAPRVRRLARFVGPYGMAGVLVLIAAFLCVITIEEQQPTGADAGRAAAAGVRSGELVLVVSDESDDAFARAARETTTGAGASVVGAVAGTPREVRQAIDAAGANVHVVASPRAARLPVLADRAGLRVLTAESYRWPVFLKSENLLNVANGVVVTALLAAGMTLVILTGGIDLSVGSLVALSAVATALVVRALGGTGAGTGVMLLAGGVGVASCAAVGVLNGLLIVQLRLPPFIATLGTMQIASGAAYLLARGASIYDLPDAFTWLGRARGPGGVPYAVVLMLGVYAAGHVLLAHTTLGRRLYAVGGNAEAARLSGVRVGTVLMLAYLVSGALAGLGGVVLASQLKAGAPTYGLSYELYAIAAVVVGGTSLAGGSGRVLGTLVGVLIISVIQNGMNLTGVESYLQKIVLGAVILAAVTLDLARQRDWTATALGRLVVAALRPPNRAGA